MPSEGWLLVGAAFVIGLGVGGVYYWALWATVQRLQHGGAPGRTAALVAVGYTVRVVAALGAFLWLATWGVASLLAGVAGFTLSGIGAAAQGARRAPS